MNVSYTLQGSATYANVIAAMNAGTVGWPGSLTGNGFANNWTHVAHASLDAYDDGKMNGSAGVKFVDSHDVAQAFRLALLSDAAGVAAMRSRRPGRAKMGSILTKGFEGAKMMAFAASYE